MEDGGGEGRLFPPHTQYFRAHTTKIFVRFSQGETG